MQWEIAKFEPQKASPELWKSYFDFNNKYLKESDPTSSLPKEEHIKKIFLEKNPNWLHVYWLVFAVGNEDKIVGEGSLTYTSKESPSFEKNKNSARVQIAIDSEFRRKGIGTELLQIILVEAKEFGKLKIETSTSTESGNNFCKKYGGKKITESTENRLYLTKVNWKLIDEWREDGAIRSPNVVLEIYTEIPDKDLEDFCVLFTEVNNLEPSENEYQLTVTSESRRKEEQFYKELGLSQVTFITREQSGIMSGLTEFSVAKSNPECSYQGLTGVKKQFQRKGLGKWLKAEMVQYIKDNFPNTKYIMTENTTVNKPMLSINKRLGFEVYRTTNEYNFLVRDLLKFFKK